MLPCHHKVCVATFNTLQNVCLKADLLAALAAVVQGSPFNSPLMLGTPTDRNAVAQGEKEQHARKVCMKCLQLLRGSWHNSHNSTCLLAV